MRLRKSISFILIICIMMTSYSFTVFAGELNENDIMVFHDDFEKGNQFFSILPDWIYSNGMLTSPLNVGANAYFSEKDTVNYRDYTVDCLFSVDSWNSEVSSWIGIIVRSNICIYFNKDGEIRIWDMEQGKDIDLCNFLIELGRDYEIKICCEDKYIQIFVRKAGDEYFRDCGTYVDNSESKGNIYFRSIATITNIKEVSLSIPDKSDMCFTKYGEVGSGIMDIPFKNTKNDEVTFISSNNDIAEVIDGNKLNVKTKGVFTITASDENGNELSSAAFGMCVLVDAIDFAMGEKTIYVGDSMDVRAYYTPASADAKKTLWESSDPDIVEIYGRGDRIGIKAKKPGNSVISAKLVYGGSIRDTAWLRLTVLPKKEPGSGEAMFAATGVKHEVPPYFFGIAQGDRCALKGGEEFATSDMIEVVKDAGFKITRVPGGGMSCYFDWRKGKMSIINYNDEFKGYTMEDIYKLANECDIPAVYCLNCSSNYNSPDDIVDCISEIKKNTDHPIFVELINEAYSASSIWPDSWQTVDGFCAEMEKYYNAIKKAHPDVLVGACGLGKDMEKRILADPNNSAFENPDDWEYTTPGRVRYWNNKLSSGDAYDAVAVHPYTHQTQITCATQYEYMRNHFAFNQDLFLNLLLIHREYKNKPLWLTEWGDIAEESMGAGVENYSRQQTAWDIGTAISDGERLLQMLRTDCVDITNYWDITGSSEFGLAPFWTDGELNDYLTKQSRFYMFQELGKVFNNNTYYHDITGVNVGYEIMDWPWSNDGPYIVNLPDISAYALGDEDKINNVVFVNHTDKEMKVSVDGLKLCKQVSFGDAENNFPNYMIKPIKSNTSALKASEVVMPTHYDDELSDTITVPGFSLVIAGADGTAVLKTDTVAGKISKINEYELNHTVVLRPGYNTAYVNNVKTVIDQDINVSPIIENGRTLLPLRFISESLGADVDFEEASNKITITLDGNTITFNVGSNVYYVNGKELVLDVGIEIIHDRTFIPLRALAESLGKTVYWDNRGLIIISNVSTSFHEPYNELNPDVFTEIIALFEGEN